MKIAFSGTHGTGKTTSTYEYGHMYKLKYPKKEVKLLNEIARDCPFKVNQNASEKAQMWIFHTQLKREIELYGKNTILICDRTIVDNLAYSKVLGYEKLVEIQKPIVKEHLRSYNEIHLKQVKRCSFQMNDGFRDQNVEFRDQIGIALEALYEEFCTDGVLNPVQLFFE